jgi:Uma2 family endonuclease
MQTSGLEFQAMNSAARIRKPYTYEDFCALVQDGQKADLIDGVIYMASPDNTDAADISTWLGALMHLYVESRDLGKIFGSRVACKLSEFSAPEPDILFVPKKDKKKILRGRIDGAPALAVEIVSPDSETRDYELKRELYEKYGVLEYWIIDETKKKAIFLRRGADGRFQAVKPRGDVFRSKAMKGFWLRLDWLWPDKRPHTIKALAELLRSK